MIEPKVFEGIVEYAEEYSDLSRRKRRIRGKHRVVVFIESFVEQLGSGHLSNPNISGLSERTVDQLSEFRFGLAEDERAELQLLLFELEEVCRTFADLAYSPSGMDEDYFNFEAIPAVLRAVVDWASVEDPGIEQAATKALVSYEYSVRPD